MFNEEKTEEGKGGEEFWWCSRFSTHAQIFFSLSKSGRNLDGTCVDRSQSIETCFLGMAAGQIGDKSWVPRPRPTLWISSPVSDSPRMSKQPTPSYPASRIKVTYTNPPHPEDRCNLKSYFIYIY